MPIDHESLMRALQAHRSTAKGWRADKLKSRLSSPDAPPGDAQVDPMAPPPEGSPGEEMGEPPAEAMAEGDMPGAPPMPGAAGPMDPDADAAAKLDAIRKLIGSV